MRFILIVLCFISLQLSASKDTTKPKIEFQLTANCTQFSKQFLNLSNANLDISPYLVGVRLTRGLHNLRSNIGLDYKSSTTKNPNESSSSFLLNTINYRLGYQYELPINSAFTAYTGVDALYKYNQNKSTSTGQDFSSESNLKSNGIGCSLNLGFQWNLSKRISIYTETTLNAMSDKSLQFNRIVTSTFNNYSESTSDEVTLNVTPPTSIFFQLKF